MERPKHWWKSAWIVCFTITAIVAASGYFTPLNGEEAQAGFVIPEAQKLSPALAASVPAAMTAFKQKAIHLIDIRKPSDFNQFHIPGSLNISLHAVRTKLYLKNKPVVLVNKGFALKEMADACRNLNAAGFKAAILAGGLVSWKAKGGKIEGDPFAMLDLNRVSAMQYLKEAGSGHHLLVEASADTIQNAGPMFKNARQIDVLGNNKHLAQLKKTLRKNTSDPFRTLVIFSRNGEQDAHIQRLLFQEGISEFFIIRGGRQACEKQLDYLHLARRPIKERTINSNGCPTCAAR